MFSPISLNANQIVTGYLMYIFTIYVTPYLPDILLCVIQYFGIRRHVILGDKEKYKKIIKRLEKETSCSSYIYKQGKSYPAGYFIGKSVIGIYDRDSKYVEDEKLHIFTTDKYYKYLFADCEIEHSASNKDSDSEGDLVSLIRKNKPTELSETKSKIKVYIRSGSYKNFYYSPLILDVSHINPIGTQAPVVEDILLRFKKHKRVTAFIHGVTSAGKSSVGYLVAKALNGGFCHTFKPTDPGDNFNNLIMEFNNRSEDETVSPFIIVLEEANEIIHSVHSKKVHINVETPTLVNDKSSWCGFLDDMIFYKNVILILTSNESKESIDKLDPAYLRKGRIDVNYDMLETLHLEQLID